MFKSVKRWWDSVEPLPMAVNPRNFDWDKFKHETMERMKFEGKIPWSATRDSIDWKPIVDKKRKELSREYRLSRQTETNDLLWIIAANTLRK
jgi:hypothetical protein